MIPPFDYSRFAELPVSLTISGLGAASLAQVPAAFEGDPVLGVGVPVSVGALLCFLVWALKESYRMRSEDAVKLAEERARIDQQRVDEAREYAQRLEQIYASKNAELARIYNEVRADSNRVLEALLARMGTEEAKP